MKFLISIQTILWAFILSFNATAEDGYKIAEAFAQYSPLVTPATMQVDGQSATVDIKTGSISIGNDWYGVLVKAPTEPFNTMTELFRWVGENTCKDLSVFQDQPIYLNVEGKRSAFPITGLVPSKVTSVALVVNAGPGSSPTDFYACP